MSPYGYDRRSEETHRRSDGYDRFQDPVEEVVRLLPLLHVPSGTGKMERLRRLISLGLTRYTTYKDHIELRDYEITNGMVCAHVFRLHIVNVG